MRIFTQNNRDPVFRLLIVSACLAVLSVLPWLLYDFELLKAYRHVFHMISGIQGFLSCIVTAMGIWWLSRLSTENPVKKRSLELVFLTMPILTTISAWFRFIFPDEFLLAFSQFFWLILVTFWILFFSRQLIRFSNECYTACPVWFCTGIFFGLGGSVLLSSYSSIVVVKRIAVFELLFLGRGFLLQGFFLCILIGSVPLIMWKTSFSRFQRKTYQSLLFHLFMAFAMGVSFFFELFISISLGFSTRALVVILVYFQLFSPFSGVRFSGFSARVGWLSLWLIPIGYLLGAVFPGLRSGSLHLVFIGGFTMVPLMTVLQFREKKSAKSYPVAVNRNLILVLTGLFMAAMILRIFYEILIKFDLYLLGLSALFFIVAVALWGYLFLRNPLSIKSCQFKNNLPPDY